MKPQRQETTKAFWSLRLHLENDPSWECPKCEVKMETVYFGTVSVEQCPHCSGIFLDEGELERIGQLEKEPVYAKNVVPFLPRRKRRSRRYR